MRGVDPWALGVRAWGVRGAGPAPLGVVYVKLGVRGVGVDPWAWGVRGADPAPLGVHCNEMGVRGCCLPGLARELGLVVKQSVVRVTGVRGPWTVKELFCHERRRVCACVCWGPRSNGGG